MYRILPRVLQVGFPATLPRQTDNLKGRRSGMVQNLVAEGEELAVLLAADPLRGRHGRLGHANPQGTSVDLPWGPGSATRDPT